jgi:hypothetical protein
VQDFGRTFPFVAHFRNRKTAAPFQHPQTMLRSGIANSLLRLT